MSVAATSEREPQCSHAHAPALLLDRSHDPTAFWAECFSQAGVIVLAVHGELDLATAPALDQLFVQAGQARGPVLVDLCATTFIDVAGFRSLSLAHHVIGWQGRRFAVVAVAPGSVDRMLELTAVHVRLARYPDRFSALDALRAP